MLEKQRAVTHRQPGIDRCWVTIGVHGDRSCPELTQHVHCRNCPVYHSGAKQLLDREAPADYLAQWTEHVAQVKALDETDTQSVVIFRVGQEWFAFPTPRVIEVANPLPIHSLPHRASGGVILGLASVRGELLIAVSLVRLLGLESASEPERRGDGGRSRRLLVIRGDHLRAVCPVDEVHGIHRFHPREIAEAPSTVAKAVTTHSRALLPWRDHSVGLLDDESLFQTLKRSIA